MTAVSAASGESGEAPGGRPGGRLFVVGTPIGNLDDLSPRARDVLAAADVVAAEDTRRTRALLSRIGVEARLIAYHEHNEEERVPDLLARLARGESVALVSDAGTPLVSDPGLRLVRAARAAGLTVVPVPGPSAVLAALSAAGLPTDRFAFEGFLPRRPGARDERLRALRAEPRTMVFFESVHRLEETLGALAAELGAERRAVIGRELTKVHEQIVDGTLATLRERLDAGIPLLGEFVLVVAGAAEGAPDEARALEIFAMLSAELPPDRALALTARLTGMPRNALYKLTRVRARPAPE
jgi:16S rRNA (cytidine1402-2'-O)-methyltransferase